MTKKIIVADDSQTIQKVIKITFANKDFELIPCLNESELEKNLSEDISLILLDFSLSESKTGYELGAEISSKFSNIPIMALLGTFDTVDEDSFLSSGYSDKVVKPFETEKFVSKCLELVANGPAQRSETSFDASDVDDKTSEWDINSPQLNESSNESIEVEASVDDQESHNELGNELGSWGFQNSDMMVKDVTNEYTEFPPVIENVVEEQPFASKFLSAENLIDKEDLQEVEDHLDDVLSHGADEVSHLEEQNYMSDADLEADRILAEEEEDLEAELNEEVEYDYDEEPSLELESSSEVKYPDSTDSEYPALKEVSSPDASDADNFWAIDEKYDESESTSDEDATREIDLQAFRDSTNHHEDEMDYNEKIDSDHQEEVVAKTTDFKIPNDLESKLRADLEPLVEKYIQEYCRERIEKVAWEIIPDLAENLIKRELKDISKTVIGSLDN